MPGSRLSLLEREVIDLGLREGRSLRCLARELGRAASTLSREVRAVGGRHGYRASVAQRRAVTAGRRPKTPCLVADAGLADRVTAGLQRGWSPAAVAASLGGRVCAETIYQAVYSKGGRGLPEDTYQHLPRRQRARYCRAARRARQNTPGPLGAYNRLSARPARVEERTEPGHWEGDLICGPGNRSATAVLVERLSRYHLLVGLPLGHGAAAVLEALYDQLRGVPRSMRRSLSWDQGREMTYWADLQRLLDLPVYFCDPHSPWQKGTVEQTNGLLRRALWLPAGTDLSTVPTRRLQVIQTDLNDMPRRIHNWKSATTIYNQHVATTA